jgi:hypothetical protein
MIASYQIHNVLKLYTDRLSKKRRLKHLRGGDDPVLQPEATRLSNDGRRDYLVERLAADIVSRIQNREPQKRFPGNSPEAVSEPKADPAAVNGEFVYNIISDDQCKKTVRLSLEDSDFLMRRIEEMARNRPRNRKAFGPK